MQLTDRWTRRRDRRERAAGLGATTMFRYCDEAELSWLAAEFVTRDVPADTVLCRAGDLADETYVIERGEIAVERGGRCVATLTDGDIAGELAPLGTTVRTADLVARTDCSLLVAPSRRLAAMLSDSAGLRRALTPLLAVRTDQLRRIAAEEGPPSLRN